MESDKAKNKKIICLVTYWTQTNDAFFPSDIHQVAFESETDAWDFILEQEKKEDNYGTPELLHVEYYPYMEEIE